MIIITRSIKYGSAFMRTMSWAFEQNPHPEDIRVTIRFSDRPAVISFNWIPIRRISGIVSANELRRVSACEDYLSRKKKPFSLPFVPRHLFRSATTKTTSSIAEGRISIRRIRMTVIGPSTTDIYSSYRFRRSDEGRRTGEPSYAFPISMIASTYYESRCDRYLLPPRLLP